ncbi:hypothetical protein D918_06173 [Trichuris suis]|nr:hypothetical protein D918_06173 [Trichuris suis]
MNPAAGAGPNPLVRHWWWATYLVVVGIATACSNKPNMATTVQQPASGLVEMNALLEKFRQNRSRRESSESTNGRDPVSPAVHSKLSNMKCDFVKSPVTTNECTASPESPDGGASRASQHQPTLRPSTPMKSRQILADRYNEQVFPFVRIALAEQQSFVRILVST